MEWWEAGCEGAVGRGVTVRAAQRVCETERAPRRAPCSTEARFMDRAAANSLSHLQSLQTTLRRKECAACPARGPSGGPCSHAPRPGPHPAVMAPWRARVLPQDGCGGGGGSAGAGERECACEAERATRRAVQSGGAISTRSGGTVNIASSSFTHNTAAKYVRRIPRPALAGGPSRYPTLL